MTARRATQKLTNKRHRNKPKARPLLTALEKVTSRKAEQIADRLTQRLGRIPSAFIKTLTFDNDKAFARHKDIADQLQADTYFTRPYTSQDKGTVENRIWVIRRFFPKGTDLRNISEQRIKTVEQYLNFRPLGLRPIKTLYKLSFTKLRFTCIQN